MNDKLKATVLLLSSGHDGEVVAAARAINRQLAALGKDWHWLADQLSGGARTNSAFSNEAWDLGFKAGQAAAARSAPPARQEAFEHQAAARWILVNKADLLRSKEREFLNDMSHWRGDPTERQAQWLESLVQRFGYAA